MLLVNAVRGTLSVYFFVRGILFLFQLFFSFLCSSSFCIWLLSRRQITFLLASLHNTEFHCVRIWNGIKLFRQQIKSDRGTSTRTELRNEEINKKDEEKRMWRKRENELNLLVLYSLFKSSCSIIYNYLWKNFAWISFTGISLQRRETK